LRKEFITWIRKRIGDSSICPLSLLFRESEVADKAKHQANNNKNGRMSADEPLSPIRLSLAFYFAICRYNFILGK